MIVTMIIIGLFILLGIYLSTGRGSFLIAGYNTMPKEEKEKYDASALCKFMGKMMFALSFSMILWVLSEALEVQWLFYVGLVLFMAIVIFILVYVNTGNSVMKEIKWGMLFILILFAGCSSDDTALSPEQAGQDVIDLLRAGNYQSVHDQWFDEELKASLSTEELESAWEKQVESSGEFVAVHSPEASNRGENVDVIEAKVEYTNVIFEVRMIFNDKQRLVGFNVSDRVANASLPDTLVEEGIVVGEGTNFELNGTLTLPKENQERLPAVVLVHGSGSSDQDETVFAYKPFRDIAWGLAELGIAVIRYDKRTYTYGEKLAQDISDFTVYEETVEDAIRATQLVKSDDRIDENNVYMIGHSLGGMLAPRIDAQGGDYAGVIMLAGSPRPLWEIVYDQNKDVLENEIMDESAKEEQAEIVEDEYKKAQQLQNMTDDEAKNMTVFGMNGYYLKEMDQYDVKSMVSKLEKPLLMMQGEDDFQVYYEKDFMIWKDLLEDREHATLMSYPNLNHFFVDYQGPDKGTIAEYETPKQVDKEVIHDIGRWILEHQN